MRNLPPSLEAAVRQTRSVMPDPNSARVMINCFDLTQNKRNVNPTIISYLSREVTQGRWGKIASLSVDQIFLTQAFNSVARQGVGVGTFINYPSGKGAPEQTAADVRRAVIKGANEIELVMNFEAMHNGQKDEARALIEAAKIACAKDAMLKVVIETSTYNDYGTLYEAATLAIDCGADMLVTMTGADSLGRTTTSPEAAATLLQAIKDSGKPVGLKIAGDGDTLRSAAPYIALARRMMGKDWVRPDNFRIAGNNLHKEAAGYLNNPTAGFSKGI